MNNKKPVLAAALLMTALPALNAQTQPSFNLGRIIVTPTKIPIMLKDSPLETSLVTGKEIKESNSQTVSDSVKYIPGVQIGMNKDSDRAGNLNWRSSLRGLRFNEGYALVLIDGERVKGGGMGEYGYGINQIPPEMIERIEIVKGPSSVLYGSDAMAGVINIITKSVPAEKTSLSCHGGYGTHDASNAGFFLGKRIGKLGYALSYSREKSEAGKYGRTDDYEADFGEIKLDYRLSSSDKMGIKLSAGGKNWTYSDWDSMRASAKWERNFSEDSGISLKSYWHEWDFHNFTPGYTETKGYMRYRQSEARYFRNLGENHTLLLGGEYLEEKMKYNLADRKITTDALFAEDEWAVLSNMTLNAGLRLDAHSQFGAQASPRASMLLNPDPETTIRASVGRSFKSPTIRQLYYKAPYLHGTYYISSNPNLKPEKGTGYSLSAERRIGEKLMVDLGVFRNDIKNMVLRYDTGTLYNGKTLKSYKNAGRAMTQGIEFALRAEISGSLSGHLSYTLLDTEDKDTGKELTYRPAHTAGWKVKYENRKLNMSAGIGVRYVGKMYKDDSNSTSTDPYFTTEVKVSKKISDFAEFSLEADNIFKSDYGDPSVYREGQTFMGRVKIYFE